MSLNSSAETQFSLVLDAFLSSNIETPTQLLRSLKIFNKIVKNVLVHPLEMKYRKIPISNRKIREVLGSLHGSEEVLSALGFQLISADKDYWVLDASIDPKLHFSSSQIDLLDTCLANVVEMCNASVKDQLSSVQQREEEQQPSSKLSNAISSSSSPSCHPRDQEQKRSEGEGKVVDISSSSSVPFAKSQEFKSSSGGSLPPPKQLIEGSSVVSGVPPNSVEGLEGNIGAREYQGKYGIKSRGKGGRGVCDDDTDKAVRVYLRKDKLPERDSMAQLVERRLLKKNKRLVIRKKKKKSGGGKQTKDDCNDDYGGRSNSLGGIRRGRISNFGRNQSSITDSSEKSSNSSLIDMKHGRSSKQTKRFFTASELEEIAKKRYEEATHFGDVKDMDYIGRLMLHHTNEFRKQNGMSAVVWSQEIADICRVHSKMMGDKKIKFGHDGFKSRVGRFRRSGVYHRSAAENVAMNKGLTGYGDTAKAAVVGWINSPGHRKNLLSKSNYCGIGVYRSFYGEYYATQILADVDETQVQIEKRLRGGGGGVKK